MLRRILGAGVALTLLIGLPAAVADESPDEVSTVVPTCGGFLLADPAGDATSVESLDSGSNVPSLDVVSITASTNSHFGLFDIVVSVADLGVTAVAPGELIDVTFVDQNGATHSLSAFRGAITGAGPLVINPTFKADGKSVTGSYDAAADTITVSVPRSEFSGGLSGEVTFSEWSFASRRTVAGAFSATADDGSNNCASTFNLGI
ncbi:MAG: hypothetical protein ACR2H3_16435 [Acidimicrobiales bacterium]